ncbi:MAG: response regulator [Bryobacteraceae bacterium]
MMPHAFVNAWIWIKKALPWLWLCAVLPRAAAETPQLSERDVINAADHSSGKVAPGEIVTLFPSNAGPAVLAGTYSGADGKVITLLGETRVLFDGIAAPMAYSVRGQVGAVVPYEIANRKTTEVVVEYQGVRSPAVTLPVVDRAPALFTLDLSGSGQAAILNNTGCCNSARNPAKRGTIAVLYATGEGQTTPRGISGSVSVHAKYADYPTPQSPVRVTVGGVPAEIVFAGEAPHAIAGLLQVNFRVPVRAPVGDAVPVVLSIGNSRTKEGVTMAVRSAGQSVLVIGDEAAMRNRLARVLRRAGYEVFTAENDEEALRQAKERPIDLVIASLIDDSDGVEAIRAMQAEQPRLKLITIAGALGPATLRTADLLGAQAVLTNPLSATTVLRRVREVLRNRSY